MSSELLRVECLRTIDRLLIRADLDHRTVADRRGALLETIEAIDLVALDAPFLGRLTSTDLWRIRVGDLRVIYLVDEAEALVIVLRVARRSEGTYRRVR